MRKIEDYLALNYRMTIRHDDDSYVAEVEELPGCMADGEAPAQAIDNLKEAMRSWITSRLAAGLEVPEPRGEEDFSGKFVVRMPRFLHARLARQARAEGASLNQYVVSLLSSGSENWAATGQRAASPWSAEGTVLAICPQHPQAWAGLPEQVRWYCWHAVGNLLTCEQPSAAAPNMAQWAAFTDAQATKLSTTIPREAKHGDRALFA